MDSSVDGSDNFSGDVSVVRSVLVGRLLDNTDSSASSGVQQAESNLQGTSALQSGNRHSGGNSGARNPLQMLITLPSTPRRVVSGLMEGHMVRGGLLRLPHVPTREPSLAAEPRHPPVSDSF